MHNSLIDTNVIQALTAQIGHANVGVVVAKAEQEVPILWDKLVDATIENDTAKAQGHIHSLASLLRSVGLMSVGDALANIESQLRLGEKLDPLWIEDLKPHAMRSMQELAIHTATEPKGMPP